jgi:hypothetical protein
MMGLAGGYYVFAPTQTSDSTPYAFSVTGGGDRITF